MGGWAAYLCSSTGSWRALLTPQPGATVVEESGFLAAVSPPYPVFDGLGHRPVGRGQEWAHP